MKLFSDKLREAGISSFSSFEDLFNITNNIINSNVTHLIPVCDPSDSMSYMRYDEMATISQYSTIEFIQAVYVEIRIDSDSMYMKFNRSCINPLNNGINAKIYPIFSINFTDADLGNKKSVSMFDGGNDYLISLLKYDVEGRAVICDAIHIDKKDQLSILAATELRLSNPERYNMFGVEEIFDSLGISFRLSN